MKTAVTSLLCILALSICHGQYEKPDMNEWNLKGPVKSVYQTYYAARIKFRKIRISEEVSYHGSYNFYLEFDPEKNLTYEIDFQIDSTQGNHYYFLYEAGRLSQMRIESYTSSDISTGRIFYDSLNRISRVIELESMDTLYGVAYNSRGDLTYRMRNQGHTREYYRYNAQGMKEAHIEINLSGYADSSLYFYDTSGHLIYIDHFWEAFRYGRDSLIYNELGQFSQHQARRFFEETHAPMMYVKSRGCNFIDLDHDFGDLTLLTESRNYTNNADWYDANSLDYDSSGNIVATYESYHWNGNAELSQMNTYSYNQQGDEITAAFFTGPDTSLVWTRTAEYTYDPYNNWIEKIIYQNGKPVFAIRRTITYYAQ